MKRFIYVLAFIILSAASFAQQNPYTILISFDGFRWDYSNRGITPNMDTLKMRGVETLSLRPSYPSITFPNHYSIVSGSYPEHHGILQNVFTNIHGETYHLKDTVSVRQGKWYKREAFWTTARKHGIVTASYYWPGSEVKDKGVGPTYVMPYNHVEPHKNKTDTVIQWLSKTPKARPHFICLYFHDTDTYGHKFGPNSVEIDSAIMKMDTVIGDLTAGLKKINMLDSVNIIVVSDHGMAEVSNDRVVNVEKPILGDKYTLDGDGPFMFVFTGKDTIQTIYEKLKKNEKHYKVYLKTNMPPHYYFDDNEDIAPIIIVAEPGWVVVNNSSPADIIAKYGKGKHGYEKDWLDMHGTFIAAGPAFKEGYKTGTVWNIDIYPLLCKMYNIPIDHKIDGDINRIRYILKDEN